MSSQIKTTNNEPEANVFTNPEIEIQPPDGGWGWVVCFAAFMTNFTVSGVIASNGIILLALLDLFEESVAKTSLIGSVLSGVSMFGGPLVLILMRFKASHRQIMMAGGMIASVSAVASSFAPNVETLTVTYGVLAGMSLAINFFSANVILGCYFNKKRAIAQGIAGSGAGCGGFVLSYFTETSISFYGIRGTFLLLGGLFLNLTVYGALCRPLKRNIKTFHKMAESRNRSEPQENEAINHGFKPEVDENKLRNENVTSNRINDEKSNVVVENVLKEERNSSKFLSRYFDVNIFKNKMFDLLLLIYGIWAVGDSLITYLPVCADNLGMSREEGANIIAIFTISSTFSQLLLGFLADIIRIPTSYLLFIALLGMSASILSMSYCQTFLALASSTAIFSMSFNFGVPLRIVLSAAVLGIKQMSSGYSILSVLIGIAYFIYTVVTGAVFDETRSFAIIFYMDSAILFLATILSIGIIFAQKTGKFVE